MMKSTRRVQGHSLIRSLICSCCPATCLLHTACFGHALRHAHSLTHSLAPGLWAWGLCIWIECIDHLQFQSKVRSLARSHHSLVHSHRYIVCSLACSLTRSRDHGKMCYILSQFQHVSPTPRRAFNWGWAVRPSACSFARPLALLLARSLTLPPIVGRCITC